MTDRIKTWDEWIETFSSDLMLAGFPCCGQDWGSANANPSRCKEFIDYYIKTDAEDPIACEQLADLVLSSASLYLQIAQIPHWLEDALRHCIETCKGRWGLQSNLYLHSSIVRKGDNADYRKAEPFSYWLADHRLLKYAPSERPALPQS